MHLRWCWTETPIWRTSPPNRNFQRILSGDLCSSVIVEANENFLLGYRNFSGTYRQPTPKMIGQNRLGSIEKREGNKAQNNGIFRNTAKGAKNRALCRCLLNKPAPNADGEFGKPIGRLMIGKEIAEFFGNRIYRTCKRNFKRKLLLA